MRGRSIVEISTGESLVTYEWKAGFEEPHCTKCEPILKLAYRPDRQGD